jgi:hypothetical protein
MSQKMRAVSSSPSVPGMSWNELGSGKASTSLSWTRLNPSIAEPSNCTPSSKAESSSTGEMATDLICPRTSVNQRRTSRTRRSSTVRST